MGSSSSSVKSTSSPPQALPPIKNTNSSAARWESSTAGGNTASSTGPKTPKLPKLVPQEDLVQKGPKTVTKSPEIEQESKGASTSEDKVIKTNSDPLADVFGRNSESVVPKGGAEQLSPEQSKESLEQSTLDQSKESLEQSSQSLEQSEEDTMKKSKAAVSPKKAPEKTAVTSSMKEQADFNIALRTMCPLVKADEITKYCKPGIQRLQLLRALPGVDLFKVVKGLPNLRELDVSSNNLGPQGFRALMLAMAVNGTIKSLNVANNQTDVDSAKSIGMMLSTNRCLMTLDLSNNYLGKDFLSRSIGPALKVNQSLQSLKLESCGSTDLNVFLEGLLANTTINDLNLNHNEMGDKAHLGIGIAKCLKKPDCALQCLQLRNCGINAAGMREIGEALKVNTSLQVLNLAGNEMPSLGFLMEVLYLCLKHPNLAMVTLGDCNILDKAAVKSESIGKLDAPSQVQFLSLSGLTLSDEPISSFFKTTGARLTKLENLNLSSNSVSMATLKTFQDATTREDGHSSLETLHLCLNDVSYLPEFLSASNLVNLRVLNLRRARVKPTTIQDMAPSISKLGITTLILNGLKLSRTDALKAVLGDGPNSSLEQLSVSSCALTDGDVKQISDAIKVGCRIQMLDVSANRITDKGVADIVVALMTTDTFSLQMLDLASNQITSTGAESLSKLFLEKKYKSQLHTLKLDNNNIGSAGLVTLMKSLHAASPLLYLAVNSQNANYDEDEMQEIYMALAQSLGFEVKLDADSEPQVNCSKLPALRHGLVVNLQNLGGDPGPLGKQMDSVAIATDNKKKHMPYLTFSDALSICSALKGSDKPNCLLSGEEWSTIIGADKDAPSWLQIDTMRDLAVYLTNLPVAVTEPKLEGFLESEADCSVKEVCLMKDPVLRKNNGLAWVLMVDEISVKKAVDHYLSGQSQIIGQPFNVSRIQVKVDDSANAQAIAKAKAEVEQRLKKQKADEASHRQLIGRLYHESQARHEYRLKHPAYADGRIW